MKLDGMDAAARAAGTQTQALDQQYASAGAAAGAQKKSTDVADQVVAGVRRARAASDPQAQSYERSHAQQDEGVSEKFVRESVEKANRVLAGSDRKFVISIHEKTHDVMVKVVDTVTNETIREIPPQKIVDLVVSLCEMAGILYDEKG